MFGVGAVEPGVEAARRDWARRADEEAEEKVDERYGRDEVEYASSSSSSIAFDSTLPARLSPSLPALRTFFLFFLRHSAASPVCPSESSTSSRLVSRSLSLGIPLRTGADDGPPNDCERRCPPPPPGGPANAPVGTRGAAGIATGVELPDPSGLGPGPDVAGAPMAAIIALDARRFRFPRPMPSSSPPIASASSRGVLKSVELSARAGGRGAGWCWRGTSPRTYKPSLSLGASPASRLHRTNGSSAPTPGPKTCGLRYHSVPRLTAGRCSA